MAVVVHTVYNKANKYETPFVLVKMEKNVEWEVHYVMQEVNELDDLDTTTLMEEAVDSESGSKRAVRRGHRGFHPGETGDYGDAGEIRDHRGSVV